MRLKIEQDTCTRADPCPKIASLDGDDHWIFVVGKRPTSEERAMFGLPDDEDVVKYPRQSALAWAAPQLRALEVP